MACNILTDKHGGITGVACTRGTRPIKCVTCGKAGVHLCDYPTGKGKTCDNGMCAEHRKDVGAGLDYCPEHRASR